MVKFFKLLVLLVPIIALQSQSNPFVWGGNDRDELRSVIQNSAGNYVVAGFTKSTNMPNHQGGKDILILEFSESGGNISNPSNYLITGDAHDQELYKFIETSTGDYVGCGTSIQTTDSGVEGYIIKTNSSLVSTTQLVYGNSGGEEELRDIVEIDDGYLVAGFDEVNGERRMWLFKLNTDCSINGSFTHFGSDDGIPDAIYSMAKIDSSSFYIAGSGLKNIRKIDSDLNEVSSWLLDILLINDVIVTKDDGFIVAGAGNNNVQKCDFNGTVEWVKQYSGDTFTAIDQKLDGTYILTGYTSTQDIIILKLNGDGEELSYETYSGSKGSDQGLAIINTPDYGHIAVGFTYTASTGGASDVWVKKYEDTNLYPPATNLFGENNSATGSIDLIWDAPTSKQLSSYTVHRDGNVLETGILTTSYSDTSITIPDTYSYYITAVYSNTVGESEASNVVDVAFSSSITSDILSKDINLFQNYPNPFNPVTKIRYALSVNGNQLAEIVVFNASGQEVWSSQLTAHSSQLTGSILFDGSKFNSGIYYYSLIVDGKRMSTKSMVLMK